MASGTISKPPDNGVVAMVRTYVANEVVTEANFNRCSASRIGNIGFFNLNLSVTATSTSEFVQIGTTTLRPYATVLAAVPIQGTSNNVTIQISTTGVISVYKANTSTGFVRTPLVFSLASI